MGTNLVSKSNILITASYSLGSIEQKLILCFLGNIDNNICKKVGKERDNLEVISADKWYTINIKDYAELYGVTSKYAKEELETAVLGLYNSEIQYTNEKGLLVRTRWISSTIEYDKDTYNIKLAWALGIIPYISQLRANFTSYHLHNIRSLTSTYSIRWYEIFIMELNRSRKKSIELTLQVEDIRKIFNLQDKYKLFTDFIKRVVEEPINQINKDKNTNINIVIGTERRKYTKIGKRIVSITFGVEYKTKVKKTVYAKLVES